MKKMASLEETTNNTWNNIKRYAILSPIAITTLINSCEKETYEHLIKSEQSSPENTEVIAWKKGKNIATTTIRRNNYQLPIKSGKPTITIDSITARETYPITNNYKPFVIKNISVTGEKTIDINLEQIIPTYQKSIHITLESDRNNKDTVLIDYDPNTWQPITETLEKKIHSGWIYIRNQENRIIKAQKFGWEQQPDLVWEIIGGEENLNKATVTFESPEEEAEYGISIENVRWHHDTTTTTTIRTGKPDTIHIIVPAERIYYNITANLTDQHGQPIPKAEIIHPTYGIGPAPRAITNNEGRATIENIIVPSNEYNRHDIGWNSALFIYPTPESKPFERIMERYAMTGQNITLNITATTTEPEQKTTQQTMNMNN